MSSAAPRRAMLYSRTSYLDKSRISHEYQLERCRDHALLRSSRKGGALASARISRRSISVRIKTLGAAVGADGLTAHDCRHCAATRDGKRGKSVRYLMDKCGWTSAQTAMRYVQNDGLVVVD